MKLHPHATRGHLIVGSGLVLLSLGCAAATHIWSAAWLPWMVFFFGVWGVVELGCWLEWRLSRNNHSGGNDVKN